VDKLLDNDAFSLVMKDYVNYLTPQGYNYSSVMALNSLLCADVPLRNRSLTHVIDLYCHF